MPRKLALTVLRVAGYHDDRQAWTRTYTSNRISYTVALEAFAAGQRAKIAGVRCNCYECKASAAPVIRAEVAL